MTRMENGKMVLTVEWVRYWEKTNRKGYRKRIRINRVKEAGVDMLNREEPYQYKDHWRTHIKAELNFRVP